MQELVAAMYQRDIIDFNLDDFMGTTTALIDASLACSWITFRVEGISDELLNVN